MHGKPNKPAAAESKGSSNDKGLKEGQVEGKISEAPDGGWGWVVVFSSFVLHIIVDGITYSFGVLFIALLEDFKGGKGDTAWILSIFVGITLGAGPLASALVNKYNCRTVSCAGSVIGAIGFLISPFAPSMWYLYISLGVVAGVGFALVYLPAIVIVGYYFEKRRALATGLAVAGSGFGTFIFAPFTAYLVDEYGWKQSCIILSGIILNSAVCGALFRPLPIEMKDANGKDKKKSPKKKNVKETTAVNGTGRSAAAGDVSVTSTDGHTDGGGKGADADGHKDSLAVGTVHKDGDAHHAVAGGDGLVHRPLHRKDVFYSASLHNIPLYTSHHDMYVASNVSVPASVHSLHSGTTSVQARSCLCMPPEVTSTFREMIDVSLLRDAAFILFLVSNFFTNFGFNAPFLFVPDRAHDEGIGADEAAFLLSVIGIANTVGRVFFGYISDLERIKPYRLHVYNTGLVIAGVATAVSSFGTSYWMMVVYCSVFGVFIGCYVSLTAVILVDLLGLDKLTSSFGMTLLVQGVAVLIGPPICGEIYDYTGSYMWPFVVLGSSIAVSGAMLYFLPCLTRCHQREVITMHDVEMGKRIGVTEGAIIADQEEMMALSHHTDASEAAQSEARS